MKKLYYHPICPLTRQVRIILKELDVSFNLVREDYWQRRREFLKINPAGVLPVFEEDSGLVVAGIYPVIEYIYEKYPSFNFMDEEPNIRCEIRRMMSWMNEKFNREVTKILLDEKFIRLVSGFGAPRTELIRAAKTNLNHHLNYLSGLLEKSSFIASDHISCADIAASSHISILDYFGEINWDIWLPIRNWYAALKSRPSFRPILQDLIPGFMPSASYADLDF